MLECQSSVASKPAPAVQRCTMTKNKHLTSLKAAGLQSLLHCGGLSNLKITGHALPAKLTLLY